MSARRSLTLTLLPCTYYVQAHLSAHQVHCWGCRVPRFLAVVFIFPLFVPFSFLFPAFRPTESFLGLRSLLAVRRSATSRLVAVLRGVRSASASSTAHRPLPTHANVANTPHIAPQHSRATQRLSRAVTFLPLIALSACCVVLCCDCCCSPVSFSVSLGLLMSSYKRLQKKLHPDKFAQASRVTQHRLTLQRDPHGSSAALCSIHLDSTDRSVMSARVALRCGRLCELCLSRSAVRSIWPTRLSRTRTAERSISSKPHSALTRASPPLHPVIPPYFHPSDARLLPLMSEPLCSFVCCQLSVLGVEYADGSIDADSSLLLEVMELREQVEELRQQLRLSGSASPPSAAHSAVQSSLSHLHSVVSSRIGDIERRLAVAFDNSDFEAAKAGVGELAYFNNVNKEIVQMQTVK